MVRLGFGGLVVCVLAKKLGKKHAIKLDGPWQPPPSYGTAMGPHPWQQSTQQSSNIICDGSISLKLEKNYLLLVMLLLMHIALTSTSNNVDAAT